MLVKLLRLDWLEFRRAPHWGQSMASNALLALFGIYLLVSALGLGYMAKFLISESFPEADIIQKFNGYFAIYLLVDLCVRFLLQKFPSFALTKYLTINVRKTTITRYLMVKSLLSFFNLLPLFMIFPFYLNCVRSDLNQGRPLLWLSMMLILVLINNFFSFFLDRNVSKRPLPVFIIIAGLALLVYFDFKGLYSLSDYLSPIVSALYTSALFVIPVLILGGLFYVIFKHLRSNAYSDVGELAGENHSMNNIEFGFYDSFGDIGKWMRIESKMILRNKKSKSYLLMSLLFLLYPILMGVSMLDNVYMILMVAVLMVGAFMMNYGQLLFSWNSAHFDFIITQNIGVANFLKSKYSLIAGSNVVLFVIAMPYAFINPKIVLVNFVILLFNAGVVSYFLLWFSMNNSKKMDVTKGAMFNYEGVSAAHFLIAFPVIGFPIGVFAIFDVFGHEYLGLLALALMGLLGIVFNSRIIAKAAVVFNRKKYSLHNKFTK